MNTNFGEIDELYDYFKELDEDEQKYFLYLWKHNISSIKEYTVRIKKIKESFNHDFVFNKGFHKVPGSSNFIACNGKYILHERIISLILKDVKDICFFKKRSVKFKDIDIDIRIFVLGKFMHYILETDKKVINEKTIALYLDSIDEKAITPYLDNSNKITIKSYLDSIDEETIKSYLDSIDEHGFKKKFIETIKWYCEIKNIDLNYDEIESIKKKDELEQSINRAEQALNNLEKEYEAKLQNLNEMKRQYLSLV